MKDCPVCKEKVKPEDIYCPVCGWEFRCYPVPLTGELLDGEKKRREIAGQIWKSVQQAQSQILDQMVCLLLKNNQIFHLPEGVFSFGNLNSDSTKYGYHKHYLVGLMDQEADAMHFALQVAYNLSEKERYRCRIRNLSQKGTYVNNRSIANDWSVLEPRDIIRIGKTEIMLIISK
jgi:hypothetical protein